MRISQLTPQAAIRVGVFYLVCLLLACVSFWCVVLLGSNPFTVRSTFALGPDGKVRTSFRAGELVTIQRVVCSSMRLEAQFRPHLVSELGYAMPMLGGLSRQEVGCHRGGYSFIVPALPPGRYTFEASLIYQSNLVGRDEFFQLTPVPLEVLP